jgi:hypothetical protein
MQEFPNGRNSNVSVDPNQIPYMMAEYFGPPPTGEYKTAWNVFATPPAYYNQNNTFIIQRIENVFRELYNIKEFDKIFPQGTAKSKKEMVTTMTTNDFIVDPSSPGSPTTFTTSRLETFINKYDWKAKGFQLPWQFFLDGTGDFLYNQYIQGLALSMERGLRVEVYRKLRTIGNQYLNWLLLDASYSNGEKMDKLFEYQRFYWNKIISDKVYGAEKIETRLNQEEAIAGISSDHWIVPPEADTYLKYLPENSYNMFVGHYGNKEGPLNKPNPIERLKVIGDTPVYIQDLMKLGPGVIWQPLASYAISGGYEVFQDTDDGTERTIGVLDAKSNSMKPITFSTACSHAINLINTDSRLVEKLFPNEVYGGINNKVCGEDGKKKAVKSFQKYCLGKASKDNEFEKRFESFVGANILGNEMADFLAKNHTIISSNKLPADNKYSMEYDPISGTKGDYIYLNSKGDDIIPYLKSVARNFNDIDKRSATTLNSTLLLPDPTAFFWYAYEYLTGGGENISILKITKDALDGILNNKTKFIELVKAQPKAKAETHLIWIRSKDLTIPPEWLSLTKEPVENPSKKLCDNLKLLPNKGHFSKNMGILSFYEVVFNFIKARDGSNLSKEIFQNLNNLNIDPGFNIMISRLNRTYKSLNMYRVAGNGRTGERIKLWEYAKVYDDDVNEMHNVEIRACIGFRLKDPKTVSIVRNVLITNYVCGEGIKPMKDFKGLENTIIELENLKKDDDYYSWIISHGPPPSVPILFTKKTSELGNEFLGNYNGDLYSDVLPAHKLKDIHKFFDVVNVVMPEGEETNIYKNYIGRPEPHDIIKIINGVKNIETVKGDDLWGRAYDGCVYDRTGNSRE